MKRGLRGCLGRVLILMGAAISTPMFAGEAQWMEIQSPHFLVVYRCGRKTRA
jgi:hypothetical protein